MNIETFIDNANGPIDIEDAEYVEIEIRDDGKVLWINAGDRCIVRLCRIQGDIRIHDKRKKMATEKRKGSSRR